MFTIYSHLRPGHRVDDLSTPILTFHEIGIPISPFLHSVYAPVGKRFIARDKPFIMVNKITILAKSVRVTKVLVIESRFPPHPHIKDNVLSSDIILETIPTFPQILIGIPRIWNLFPIPIPKSLFVLCLEVMAQTCEHCPKHFNYIHLFKFLSFFILRIYYII